MNKHGFLKDISIFSNFVPALCVENFSIFILYQDLRFQWVWKTRDIEQAHAVENFIREKTNTRGEVPENIKELIKEQF